MRLIVHVLVEAHVVDVTRPPHGLRLDVAEERLTLRELTRLHFGLAVALVEKALIRGDVRHALRPGEDAVRVERVRFSLRGHAVASIRAGEVPDDLARMRRASGAP